MYIYNHYYFYLVTEASKGKHFLFPAYNQTFSFENTRRDKNGVLVDYLTGFYFPFNFYFSPPQIGLASALSSLCPALHTPHNPV